MKILIIRFSSIGDIVLTTPVIRCLKKQVAGVTLHFLTKKSFAPVLSANPYIDRLHLLDDSLDTTIAALKEEGFDLVIDLHHNLRTLRIKKALRKPSKSFNKLNVQKWLLTALKINLLPAKHLVDRCLETVAHLGVKNDGAGLDYFIPENELTKPGDLPASHQLGYIGLVVGAAHATKRLPLHKLKELVKLLEHPIVVMGGPEDRSTGEVLAELDPIKIYNACGKFSLNESADLVRKAKLIITHDTGLMHIAAAFRKPVISIWGNTVPAFGMTPYLNQPGAPAVQWNLQAAAPLPDGTAIIEVKGLRCRPCSKIGHAACPKKHFRCMENIPLDQVHKKAQQLLAAR
ncbi:glycosyltransferase family 9 protein [Flavihumibacter sp. CACIAM 22H1]|uniref:glycosyltransferase family 9 protein n=1 Tax=Flavihumibacter sp. CACIAM 22H1 TaxID=1812911 RepID=UPI0007A7DD44|nr:glycosyltransferase family 9 protein [Flavihumibacter sp. CACIAM 22H1]KYP14536.1 MAG: glycosyl transferase [Flavihumibacter sp. CACIAM 22H1]